MQRDNKVWQHGGVKGDSLGHMVPIKRGGSAAKELLNVSQERDPQSLLANSQAHTRYNKVEGALAGLLNWIAGDDEEHRYAMQHMNAASVAELGLGRVEFMQADSHLLVPHTLPVAESYASSRSVRDNHRRWPLTPKRRRDGDGESSLDE